MYVAAENRYQNMPYQRCGNSGVMLPRMSFGLWNNFGEISSYSTAKEMVLGAFDLGITHFDLANNYGPPYGAAETTFGRIMASDLKPYRDELFISSKAGYDMWAGPYGNWGSKKYLTASLDQSLKRMGLDYVDVFYHHRPDPDTPLEETMDALVNLIHQGKTLYVGLSNYGPERLKQAIEILKGMGVHCLIHQHKYSMLTRGNEALIPVLEEAGVGSIAFCPLEQGILTGKYLNGIPKESRAASPSIYLNADQVEHAPLEKVRALNGIAQERGQSLAQMALVWALEKGKLTSVILGASRLSQIQENVKALENATFTAEELDRIEKILA